MSRLDLIRGIRLSVASMSLLLAAFFAAGTATVQAANRTWDGGDPDFSPLWSSRTNWNGNTNIAAGDALFFPGTAVLKTMQNDLSISNFAKLTFNDDAYILNGNSLRLTNGITANYAPTGPTRINVGVTLGDDAAFEADDASATLELNGPVNLLGFVLTNQGAGTITWLAPFRSTVDGIVRKRGLGETVVRSTNANFLGTVEVTGGDFTVHGRMTAGAIAVNVGGTLGGTGLVHAVTVNSRGTLAPGGAARGILTVTNNLTLLRGSTFDAAILGNTTGLFDQVNVLGTVNLTNAVLNLSVNFAPASPVAVTIINNDGADPIAGTFSGAPEGAVVFVNDFVRATISYTGGTGNDVTITISPVQTLTWTGSANGLWSIDANWVGGAAPQAGDSLIFPVVSVRKTATNDFPGDTLFGQIRLETNYVLLGARAALRKGLLSSHAGTAPTVLMPLLLANHQTFTSQFQDITFGGNVELGGFNLNLVSGASAVDIVMGASITGAGALTVDGPGQVSLDRSNSFTGVLDARGKVIVRHPDALGTSAQATLVSSNSELLLSASLTDNSNFEEPLNLAGTLSGGASGLIWSGNVTFESPQARVFINANESVSFTGATLGADGFVKDGPGLLQLAAIQAGHTGATIVKAGTLQVDTQLTNSTLIVSNGATVTGRGRIKNHTFLAGSVLRPGDENPAGSDVMTMEAPWNLRSNSVLRVRLNSPTDFDSVQFLGALNLGAGIVQLEPSLGYNAAVGDSFAIVTRDNFGPTFGFFAGWPEGSVHLIDGQLLRITYTNNSIIEPKSVVLTRVPTPQTWTGLGANNLWSTPQNWAGNVVPTANDILIFPPAAERRTNVNDLALGTAFTSLSVTGRYNLSGARIGLRAGLNWAAQGDDRLNLPLRLLAPQTFTFIPPTPAPLFRALLAGEIDLNGHELMVDTRGFADFARMSGTISGAGGIRKVGAASLGVFGTNTYSGLTIAEEGEIFFHTDSPAVAGAAGTVVSNLATLSWSSPNPVIEPITLSDGGGLIFVDQTVMAAPVTNLGSGFINLKSRADATLQQPLFGSGGVTIDADFFIGQTLRLNLPAHNPFNGAIVAAGVELQVNGSLSNASVRLRSKVIGTDTLPAVLTGTGYVRTLTVGTNCIFSPAGTNGGDGTTATFSLESLLMQAGSTYRVDLNGTNVANYDRIAVHGGVNVGNGVANLDVRLGFDPPQGARFVILENDGIDQTLGTFAGKPNGAIFSVGGVRMQISYTVDGLNEIALTVLGPEELTWTGTGGNGLWSTPGNWAPARAPQDGDRLVIPRTPFPRSTNNLADLELDSLRFTGTGTGNAFFYHMAGNRLTLDHGMLVGPSAFVDALLPITFRNPQSIEILGSLTALSLTLNADVTVTGTNQLVSLGLDGSGRMVVEVPNTTTLGTNSNLGGLILNNTLAGYFAWQTNGAGVFVTNSEFRFREGQCTSLAMHNSRLLMEPSLVEPRRVTEDLTFSGTSKIEFRYSIVAQEPMEVGGEVTLGQTELSLGNTLFAVNSPLVLIRKLSPGPVSGTFKNLPEGGLVTNVFGAVYRVSYTGGDGNDVTATAVGPSTGNTRVWRGLGATGNWDDPANWVGNQPPVAGDSVEFPDAPRFANTNNLVGLDVSLGTSIHRLRFTSPTPLHRVLAPSPTNSTAVRLSGGLEFHETGTLDVPGFPLATASQTFDVGPGGKVTMAALNGYPGAVVTKTGPGELELSSPVHYVSQVALRHVDGTLRVSGTSFEIEQIGGLLELQISAEEVFLYGGTLQSAAPDGFGRTGLRRIDASQATNAVVILPGRERFVGELRAVSGVTLNSNVTLRMDIASPINFPGLSGGTNDLISLLNTNVGATNDFVISGARLELEALPGYQPSPLDPVILTLSAHARTNIGAFAGLPHLSLLTNDLGVFRIFYRDYTLPPPFNAFDNSLHHDAIVLQRLIAPPQMLGISGANGPLKTVNGLGTRGATYVVEASEDLVTWTAVSAETASAVNGRFIFTDPAGLPHRFYRARLP